MGGGTGWVLEEITKIHSSGLSITYVDASAKMIALAQKRVTGENKVTFITSPIQAAIIDHVYDVVLTPFFFDNFTDKSLPEIFSSINNSIAGKVIWLYCDFQNTDVFCQRILLRAMYLFFKVSCGIEANRLPDVDGCFVKYGYQIKDKEMFMKGFIMSAIYIRE